MSFRVSTSIGVLALCGAILLGVLTGMAMPRTEVVVQMQNSSSSASSSSSSLPYLDDLPTFLANSEEYVSKKLGVSFRVPKSTISSGCVNAGSEAEPRLVDGAKVIPVRVFEKGNQIVVATEYAEEVKDGECKRMEVNSENAFGDIPFLHAAWHVTVLSNITRAAAEAMILQKTGPECKISATPDLNAYTEPAPEAKDVTRIKVIAVDSNTIMESDGPCLKYLMSNDWVFHSQKARKAFLLKGEPEPMFWLDQNWLKSYDGDMIRSIRFL